ncbi:MAG: hypothetical protein ABI947_24130 [Chloroflexota bacterium]
MTAKTFQGMMQAVLVPLICGWIVALIFGVWIARLEYNEISTSVVINPARALLIPPTQPQTFDTADLFATDHIAAEYEARITEKLRMGAALLIPQSGVMAALLVWQVILTGRSAADPQRYGIIVGVIVGGVEGAAAQLLQASWPITVVLIVLMVGVGALGGWSASRPLNIN